MAELKIKVDTHALADKLRLLSDAELPKALKSGVSKAGIRGRDYVRLAAPSGTGSGDSAGHIAGDGRDAIRSKSHGTKTRATATIYILGGRHGPAFYMYWQNDGTGDRQTRKGQNRGRVTGQHFFELGAAVVEIALPLIMEEAVDAAIAESDLK